MSDSVFFLKSISPIDGRYYNKTSEFSNYFSEYALIKYRVFIEIQYFIELSNTDIKIFQSLTNNDKKDEITILQAMGVPKPINNKKDIVRTNTPKNSIT